MLGIPPRHLGERHPDKPVRVRVATIYVQHFRADSISLPFWQDVNPEHVVDSANQQPTRTGNESELCVFACGKIEYGDLHGNANDAVGGVPETDIPCIWAALRWPPRHHDDEYLHQDEEDDHNVPCPEPRARVAHTLMSVADDVEPGG